MEAIAMGPGKGDPENGDDAPEHGAVNNDGGHTRPASEEGYRWECPYCDMEQVNTMSEEGQNALRALKSHILLTDGDGHGGVGSYPDENIEDELPQYLTPLDD